MRQLESGTLLIALVLVAMLGVTTPTVAQEVLAAPMNAVNEIPLCFSFGSGTFIVVIPDEQSMNYQLTYQNLSPNILFAHIHFGSANQTGGVSTFLCGGGTKPAPCPSSPPGSGTVTGTIVAADIVGPTSQGIAQGEFTELLIALRLGLTYANVHSDICPGGEIRGQIRPLTGGSVAEEETR
jgi:CHRD domain